VRSALKSRGSTIPHRRRHVGGVCGQSDDVPPDVGIVRRQGLVGEYVERRVANLPFVERFEQRNVVD
jgi:hypothetical protein